MGEKWDLTMSIALLMAVNIFIFCFSPSMGALSSGVYVKCETWRERRKWRPRRVRSGLKTLITLILKLFSRNHLIGLQHEMYVRWYLLSVTRKTLKKFWNKNDRRRLWKNSLFSKFYTFFSLWRFLCKKHNFYLYIWNISFSEHWLHGFEEIWECIHAVVNTFYCTSLEIGWIGLKKCLIVIFFRLSSFCLNKLAK